MSAVLALLTAVTLAGPFKVDGADLSKSLVAAGGAKVTANAIAVNGGQVSLNAAAQKTLAGQISGKPFALVVSLKDAGTGDTTALAVGPLKLGRKAGGWTVSAGAASVALGKAGGAMKAVMVADGSMVRVFRDGKIAGVAPYSAGASSPLTVGTPKGGKNPWKGTILDLQVIPRSLMPQEAQTLSQSSTAVAGKAATVEAELVALTPVPEPKDVLPYKHALITHEYKILSVKSGGLDGVQAGTTVRVVRWGIIGGQKTAISTLKKGAKVTMSLEWFKDHQEIAREFTVDKLADNFDAPFLYDVDKP